MSEEEKRDWLIQCRWADALRAMADLADVLDVTTRNLDFNQSLSLRRRMEQVAGHMHPAVDVQMDTAA